MNDFKAEADTTFLDILHLSAEGDAAALEKFFRRELEEVMEERKRSPGLSVFQEDVLDPLERNWQRATYAKHYASPDSESQTAVRKAETEAFFLYMSTILKVGLERSRKSWPSTPVKQTETDLAQFGGRCASCSPRTPQSSTSSLSPTSTLYSIPSLQITPLKDRKDLWEDEEPRSERQRMDEGSPIRKPSTRPRALINTKPVSNPDDSPVSEIAPTIQISEARRGTEEVENNEVETGSAGATWDFSRITFMALVALMLLILH